ncbi:hypothetical protein [Cyclobacterium amurskyense]|uniref:Uncharacterized protein n=1 Tax=Cyclobacterium amurskyense TaxID=320787 RepID=A0A0H4PHV2_9BACT|nr:hypothetical protein [Cyclobacterium amurskyense]AKP53754.1 hypothetical protein CA2015_4412 [Cyclobacterium amurskyense]
MVGVAAVAPEAIPFIAEGALFVQTNQLAILGAGSFVIGMLDESGQVQVPGPLDESGRFTRLIGKQILKNVRGFSSVKQFEGAVSKIIKATGVDDALVGLRGSSVTGKKFTSGEAFDAASDLDFFVVSDDLFKQAVEQGAKGKGGALRVGETLKFFPDLVEAEKQLTKELGRKSSVRIFSQEGFEKFSKEATEGN